MAAALAFLAGLTACGIATSLCELLARGEARFAEPFISAANWRRAILLLIAAGPFMLFNDALAARRGGIISSLVLALCGAASVLWLTAAGVVLLAAAASVSGFSG